MESTFGLSIEIKASILFSLPKICFTPRKSPKPSSPTLAQNTKSPIGLIPVALIARIIVKSSANARVSSPIPGA